MSLNPLVRINVCNIKTGFNVSLFCLFFILFTNDSFASSIKELKNRQIDEILFNIHAYYIKDLTLQNNNHIKYDRQQLEQLYSQLDPYSKYLNEHELTALFGNTNGHYNGFGIKIEHIEEHITITDVFNNSPAKYAGVLPNDIIISINEQSVKHTPIDEVTQLIRENQSKAINLGLKRGNQSAILNIAITPGEIKLESTTSKFLGSGTGYLAINSFSNQTLQEVVLNIKALEDRYKFPLKGLVIDLRDNPGGILESAVEVCDLFLQSGTIVTTKGRYLDSNQAFYAQHGDILKGAPIVVLINKNSASAAEVLAAALKDNKRAKIVGNQSFGKGTVQSLILLGDGDTALKLTTAQYFTPSGKSIDGIGITPDIEINKIELSQKNKAVIISKDRAQKTQSLLTSTQVDQQLVKAKQLLGMQ